MDGSDTRLLFVDDDATSLGLLVEDLADYGFAIFVARDGAEGLTIAAAERPELILLDIGLPDLSGYEVCRRLTRSPDTAGIPIIFLSVLTDRDSKLLGFACGAVDYICKPALDPAEVQARVMTHLAQSRRLRLVAQRLAAYEGRYGSLAAPPESPGGGEVFAARASRIEKVRTILDAALGEHLAIEALAERVHLHPNTLSRQFSAVYGQSLSDYRRERRLMVAARLLRETDLPIKSIVREVGYRHGSDFAQAFKRRFGVAPSLYRAGLDASTLPAGAGTASASGPTRPGD